MRAFLEWIKKEPDCYGFKVHGNEFTRDQPDVVGVYRGRAFCMEFKKAGAVPRPSQASVLRMWERAGAIVGAPTSRDEAVALLRAASAVQLPQGACHE